MTRVIWISVASLAHQGVIVVDVTDTMCAEADAALRGKGQPLMTGHAHQRGLVIAAAVHQARRVLGPIVRAGAATTSPVALIAADITDTDTARIVPRDTLLTHAQLEIFGITGPPLTKH